MKTVTVGMINAFCECPQKYKYIFEEHLDIPSDDFYAETGEKIHALINYSLKQQNISKMLKALDNPENKLLKELWNNYENFKIRNVIESEYTFNVVLNENIKFSGRTDAILKKDNSLEIMDWKTGRAENINPEEEPQTIVYLYSIFKLFKKFGEITRPEQLSMTYCFLKENVSKTVNFSEQKYKKYEKFLNDITAQIVDFKGLNLYPGEKCKKCRFKIICQGTFGA